MLNLVSFWLGLLGVKVLNVFSVHKMRRDKPRNMGLPPFVVICFINDTQSLNPKEKKNYCQTRLYNLICLCVFFHRFPNMFFLCLQKIHLPSSSTHQNPSVFQDKAADLTWAWAMLQGQGGRPGGGSVDGVFRFFLACLFVCVLFLLFSTVLFIFLFFLKGFCFYPRCFLSNVFF